MINLNTADCQTRSDSHAQRSQSQSGQQNSHHQSLNNFTAESSEQHLDKKKNFMSEIFLNSILNENVQNRHDKVFIDERLSEGEKIYS